jgi:hypothetical protein
MDQISKPKPSTSTSQTKPQSKAQTDISKGPTPKPDTKKPTIGFDPRARSTWPAQDTLLPEIRLTASEDPNAKLPLRTQESFAFAPHTMSTFKGPTLATSIVAEDQVQDLLSSVEDEFLRLTIEKSQTEAQEQELLKSAEENFLKLSSLGPDSEKLEFNLVSQEKSKNDDGFEFDDDLVFEEPKPSPIRKKNLDDPLVMQESPTAPTGKKEFNTQGSPDILIATKTPSKNFALKVGVAGG